MQWHPAIVQWRAQLHTQYSWCPINPRKVEQELGHSDTGVADVWQGEVHKEEKYMNFFQLKIQLSERNNGGIAMEAYRIENWNKDDEDKSQLRLIWEAFQHETF